MATKTPCTGSSRRSPVLVPRSSTARATGRGASVPSIASTAWSHRTVTFGLAKRRCCRMRSARRLSRRCTRVTWRARLER